MYIAGRLRTASRPLRTWIFFPVYSWLIRTFLTGLLRSAETNPFQPGGGGRLLHLCEEFALFEVQLLHPRPVIDVDEQHTLFHSDGPRAGRYVLSDDHWPQGHDFLFPEFSLETDGFEDGWKEITDPCESFVHAP
jgi:hypothetical protein